MLDTGSLGRGTGIYAGTFFYYLLEKETDLSPLPIYAAMFFFPICFNERGEEAADKRNNEH